MATTRDRVVALVRAEPHLNQTQISKRVGVSRQRVQQIAEAEGILLERGVRGPAGRGTAGDSVLTRPALVPGAVPPGTPPAAAVLLVAADLVARGYSVYLPYRQTGRFDLLAVDASEKVERVIVGPAKRAGKEIRYDEVFEAKRADRHAFILTDEPIRYRPAFRGTPK